MQLIDYTASANCYKVRLALAQLHRRYERVAVDIFAGDTLTDAFAALNPARTTPVLVADDGRTLTESAAILMWLGDGTPLLSDDPWARAEVVRWLVFEQTEVIPAIGGLRFRLATGRLAPGDEDAVARRTAGIGVLELLAAHLSERDWMVGDAYSVADIALFGYVHVAAEAGYELERWPAVERWLEQVRARPDFIADLEPYPANAHPGAGRSVYD